MAWLEIIDIRSANVKSKKLAAELPQLLNSLQHELKDDIVKVYRHLTLETDYSIHIYHDATPAMHHIHPSSQHLISFLKEYGLISHSFWVEQFE